jgi:assimilatory nitrate reductase catalytic subunit
MLARVQISDEQRIGSVFAPMHWNDAYARSARVDALTAPITDPISGQPEFKHTPVYVEPYRPAWQGFVLSRERLELPEAGYCACTQGAGYWRHEIAGEAVPENWRDWVQSALDCSGAPARGTSKIGNLLSSKLDAELTPPVGTPLLRSDPSADLIEYRDTAMGRYRAACVQDGRLEAVFFIAPDQRLPEREWLASLFGQDVVDPADLAGLLAARPPKGSSANTGRTVCACFSIGEKTIMNAIREEELDSVEAVGACLKAGTGCGSCVPEIRRLIARRT